jgi:hypothetical protein
MVTLHCKFNMPQIFIMRSVAIVFVLLIQVAFAQEKPLLNIHTAMMESTLKIVGDGSIGTGFIVGRPRKNKPEFAFYTLVTVHHVLAQAKGDRVILVLRKLSSSGDWDRVELSVKVRQVEKDLWQKHPDVDLAAIHLPLPENCVRAVIPMSMLLTDAKIAEYEISPGTELLCLGYPFGEVASI